MSTETGLATTWRPRRFNELVGQSHVEAVLGGSIRTGRPVRQLLLSGTSGVGKTTTARVYAAHLLCEEDGDCGVCDICTQVVQGNHPDIIEIDAASHGGKDAIKELVTRSHTSPAQGAWKIYIIDECHAISKAGAEAFLKGLEEPPSHVVYILATTNPEKLISTIRGRCLGLNLHTPSESALVQNLKRIAKGEQWTLTDEFAQLVVSSTPTELGVRGTVMALERVAMLLDAGESEFGPYYEMLGLPPRESLDALTTAIDASDAVGALEHLRSVNDDRAVQQHLKAWARGQVGTEQGRWRFRQCINVKTGGYWTELLVVDLAKPPADRDPEAAAALIDAASRAGLPNSEIGAEEKTSFRSMTKTTGLHMALVNKLRAKGKTEVAALVEQFEVEVEDGTKVILAPRSLAGSAKELGAASAIKYAISALGWEAYEIVLVD